MTNLYKKKLAAILSKLKENGKITEKKYKELYPTPEKIPRTFGVQYTQQNSLRPTINYTGSIDYNTSRYLADILWQ